MDAGEECVLHLVLALVNGSIVRVDRADAASLLFAHLVLASASIGVCLLAGDDVEDPLLCCVVRPSPRGAEPFLEVLLAVFVAMFGKVAALCRISASGMRRPAP